MAQTLRDPRPGAPSIPGSRPIILLVEDDPDIRELNALRIERAGYAVVAVASEAEAVAVATEVQLAAAAIDLMLEVSDGWQVARSVRRTAGHERLPVVVLTVLDHPRPPPDVEVTAVLTKPARRVALERALALAVGSAG